MEINSHPHIYAASTDWDCKKLGITLYIASVDIEKAFGIYYEWFNFGGSLLALKIQIHTQIQIEIQAQLQF